MPKYKLMIARFPGGWSNVPQEHPDIADWLVPLVFKIKADARFDSDILRFRKTDTPITMMRNKCLRAAKEAKVDFVLMVDSDMGPDAYLPGNPNAAYADVRAKPFFDSSIDFMLQHNGPCIVAAPYCGPSPHENVYAFHWTGFESDTSELAFKMEGVTREDAFRRSGIERASAMPTGIILIDMRCLNYLKPPYFYYEWKDEWEDEKASTEDVTFTRDMELAGVKVYCNWDAWAIHHKLKAVGRPRLITTEQIGPRYEETILSKRSIAARMVSVGDGINPAAPPAKPLERSKNRARAVLDEFADGRQEVALLVASSNGESEAT